MAELPLRIEALQAEAPAAWKRPWPTRKRALATERGGGRRFGGCRKIGGIKLIARVLDGVGGKDLRGIAEDFKKQVGSGIVALVGTADGKAAVTVAVSADLVGRFSAADLAKAAVLAMRRPGQPRRQTRLRPGWRFDAAKAEDGLAAVKAGAGELPGPDVLVASWSSGDGGQPPHPIARPR